MLDNQSINPSKAGGAREVGCIDVKLHNQSIHQSINRSINQSSKQASSQSISQMPEVRGTGSTARCATAGGWQSECELRIWHGSPGTLVADRVGAVVGPSCQLHTLKRASSQLCGI